MLTLLTGPPTRDPGILASSDVTDLWRPADDVPWWRADADAALALVCLDEPDRRGLEGVSPQWEGHPLLATARWTLSEPIRRGLAQLAQESTLPDRGTGCSVTRLVLTLAALAPPLAGPPLTDLPRDELRDSVLLTAVQRLRERDAHALLLPVLAGTPRDLLLRTAAAPEPTDRAREAIGHVLRGLRLPDRTGAHIGALPGTALWRIATLRHLVSHRSLRAAALGWLVAADAVATSGRLVTGQALRAHGFDRETAQEWDRHVLGDLASLEAAERLIDDEPTLTPDLILGARACLVDMTASTEPTPTEELI